MGKTVWVTSQVEEILYVPDSKVEDVENEVVKCEVETKTEAANYCVEEKRPEEKEEEKEEEKRPEENEEEEEEEQQESGDDDSLDAVSLCRAAIAASETGDEVDQTIAPGVTIVDLPPSVTGFPAWRRCEEYVESEADLDRGHADWVIPEGADNSTPRILYCHGGGYEMHSPQSIYRPATSRLAAVSGMPVLAFDYRKCPEFKHPAQLDDATQAFRWIWENGPEGPGLATAVFLAGDSAGGGLALALAVKLRDEPIEGREVAGITVVSPETDLTCSGESYTTRRWVEGGPEHCDPMFRDEDPAEASMPTVYSLLGPPDDPESYHPTEAYLSVLHHDLHDLPPVQIHVGDAEVMLSDSVDFAEKAKAAGTPVELEVWPRMWHTFTQYSEGCGLALEEPPEEPTKALELQGEFLQKIAQEYESEESS